MAEVTCSLTLPERRYFVIRAQGLFYLLGFIGIVPKPYKLVRYRNETITLELIRVSLSLKYIIATYNAIQLGVLHN